MEAVLLHNSDHIASVRGLVGMVLVVGHVLLDKLLVHGDFESRNNPLEILKGDGGPWGPPQPPGPWSDEFFVPQIGRRE